MYPCLAKSIAALIFGRDFSHMHGSMAASKGDALAPALAIRATADLFLPNRAWLVAGALAGAVEWAMAALFVLIILQTIRQSKQPVEPYERFLIAALGWMLVAFGFDVRVFTQTAGVTGYRGWVNFIGRIDAPWRDLQLLGFAGAMILGVSQRFLPFIYGFHEVPARTSNRVLLLWNQVSTAFMCSPAASSTGLNHSGRKTIESRYEFRSTAMNTDYARRAARALT